MKLAAILLVLFFPSTLLAYSYNLVGTVIDASSKESVSGAWVFINKSQNYFFTDATGQFSLENINDSTVELVVTKAGYQTMVYKVSASKPVLNIRFEMIAESTDQPVDSVDLEAKKELFMLQFLGNSINASQSQISNPQVLRYSYNDTTGLLTASATAMLNIINDGLGYLINYQLESFTFNTNNGLTDVQGYCFFKQLTTQRPVITKKWDEQRMVTYNGSLPHFMRSLYADKLADEGYKLKRVRRITEGENDYKEAQKSKAIVKSGVLNMNGSGKNFVDLIESDVTSSSELRQINPTDKSILFSSASQLFVEFTSVDKFINSIANINRNNVKSLLSIKPPGVSVHANGLYFDAVDLYIEGALRERIADMLPIEYHP